MGLFDIFKKKEKIAVTVTSEMRNNPHLDDENRKFWEEYHKESARLEAKHQKNVGSIDFSKVVSGNDDEILSNTEIEFLSYLDRKKISDPKITRYWIETGIDYQAEIEKFFRSGLLAFESIESVLLAQKVADLKIFLQEQKLNITGNKEALISGILASMSTETVSAQFPPNRVCLTEKGVSVVEAKRKRDLDEKFKAASIRSHQHLQSGQLSAYRDDLVAIAEVDMEEERYQAALQALMMIFVLDVSGAPTPEMISNNHELIKEGWVKKGAFPSYHPLIVPYPMCMISKAISKLGLSIQEVEDTFRREIGASQIPCMFCSAEEMVDLFLSAVSGDGRADELVEVYKRRFIKHYAK